MSRAVDSGETERNRKCEKHPTQLAARYNRRTLLTGRTIMGVLLGGLAMVFSIAALTQPIDAAGSELRVAAVFQDHAVLQRDRSVAVWGEAAPGARVFVSLDGRSVAVDAGTDGRWRADLPAHGAGGPHTLTVESGDENRTFTDILIGDVWLCSGQSNMEFNLGRATNAQIEVGSAADPMLRLLQIEHVSSPMPQAAPGASSRWRVSDPESATPFSAVCHFFGRELRSETGVPIGLIDASWGGSVIQDWIDPETLQGLGGYEDGFSILESYLRSPQEGEARMREAIDEWANLQDARSADWHGGAFDDSDWKVIESGGYWENAGIPELAPFDGTVWFRTTITLTAEQAGEGAVLALGPIDDIDTTWVNGVRVGGEQVWNKPREYRLPEGVLHANDNHIAVRVIDTGGGGGMWGGPVSQSLRFDNGEKLQIGPDWRYRIAASLKESSLPPRTPWIGGSGLSTLYGGMIAPLTPYGVRGFTWYQGEANVAQAEEYARLVPALMASWRNAFEAPDAPFIQTQLTAFGSLESKPGQSSWAELRDAQRRAAEADPHAGMAVIVDIGDPRDIHPTQKKEVGRRLALEARRLAYGANDPLLSSPFPLVAKREGTSVRVSFAAANGGLVVIGDKRPIGFELCDVQRHCRYAEPKVEGDCVTLDIPPDLDPALVRYAWSNSPITNLFNTAMLPATPFEIPVE